MIFEDVYRGRSILPPHNVPNKPTLVRWDYTRPLLVDNVVPMDQLDADKHIRRCHDLKETPVVVWGQEVKAVYERRTQEILKDKQWFMEVSGLLPSRTVEQTRSILPGGIFLLYSVPVTVSVVWCALWVAGFKHR